MFNLQGALRVLSLAAAAGGLGVTAGEGALLGAAGVWSLFQRRGWSVLVGAAASSLLLGAALRETTLASMLCSVGVVANLASFPVRSGDVPAARIPYPLALVAGAVGALLLVFPTWLPLQQTVQPRPVMQAAIVAITVFACASALAVMTRHPVGTWWSAAMLGAALLCAGRTVSVVTLEKVIPEQTLLAAEQAERLGLRRLEADYLLDAMRLLEARKDWRGMEDLYARRTDDRDLARRNPDLLRLYAQALEQTGRPPHDVDAALQRALKARGSAEFNAWPGAARTAEAQQRAGREGNSDGLDCYAGTWCVVAASLPPNRSDVEAAVVLTLRKRAPAVGPVVAHVQLSWDGWEARMPIPDENLRVGETLELRIPLDMAQRRPGDRDVWLALEPLDGGHRLRLEKHPGFALSLGVMRQP